MLNGRSQPPVSSIKRDSWSSSGDTSYYDAKDRLTGDELETDEADAGRFNAALSVVDTPQDVQTAHERATSYYDNTAFVHDSSHAATNSRSSTDGTLKGNFFKKKRFLQRKKKEPLPAHMKAETNIDSITTGGEDGGAETAADEETEDDFGFKFRPSIPPPRPLMQSAPASMASLTLEDTLSMKRADRIETPANPIGQQNGAADIRISGILLETNIDSELDDNSSIPSSYYPDRMKRPGQVQSQQQPSNAIHEAQTVGGSLPNAKKSQAIVPMAAFQFNTAVREEDEETEVEEERAVEDDDENSSGTTPVGFRDEVPRMASANGWSLSSPVSPSVTVIENGPSQNHLIPSPYKSPAATSMSISAQSQALRSPDPVPMPPRMKARLDTDFEISSDEMDYTETTPGDMAILEYSRALEEAERMRHIAGGNYVFAKPPASQLTNSVPDYINYSGRDAGPWSGSVGLRAKSMNTLTTSRNSLRSSGISGKELLTPGRARRASLRRSRLGLEPSGGIYSIQIFDESNPALVSGNSQTNFVGSRHLSDELDHQLPEVQHHGPVRTSSKGANCFERCENACCPNTSRKTLVRYLLIVGICICFVLLGAAVAMIVIYTRRQDNSATNGA